MSYLKFIHEIHSKLKENNIDAVNWEIRSLPIVSSTNDYVNRMFSLNFTQVVVLSKVQEKGRGRGKNIWESPDGGMWLSIGVKYPSDIIELSSPIVQIVSNVLSKYTECKIKEPNDVFIGDKKVSGILVETKMKENKMQEIIVGVGINVSNQIPENISEIATRLSDHCNAPAITTLATDICYAIIKKLIDLEIINTNKQVN